jgi:hypothetical protein
MSAIKITRHISLLKCVLMTFIVLIVFPSARLVTARAEIITQREVIPSTNDFDRGKSIVIYVSATDGNDNWSGRLPAGNSNRTDGPLASLDHAREVVRSIDKTGIDRVVVLFKGGTYYVPRTVTFCEADSGTADTEIIYRNFPGESPVFSGGVRVQNWTNVGGNKWVTTLPAATQYFENLFYNGERRLRPRLGGYLGQYYHLGEPVKVDSPEPNCPIKVNDNPAKFECFDRFRYLDGDPIGSLTQDLEDVEILNFQQFSTSMFRISSIDTTKRTVYVTGVTTYSDSNYHQDGFQMGRRYLVENVQSALTEPGQWFLDRTVAGAWTLTYLAKPDENPNVGNVIIPQTAPPLVRTYKLHNVTFQGLTFNYDNYTLSANGHPGRELEIDIPPMFSIQNSQYITFDSGTFAHINGTGLEILSCLPADPNKQPPFNTPPTWCKDVDTNAVTANNVVRNSRFYDIGVLGMRIGDPWVPAETDGNIPQQITVENNVVEGYGRVIPAAFGIGQGMGHDNLYTHNDVYDGYHCAISISEQSGNHPPNGINGNPPIGNGNNTISFNHVYNLLQGIMDDGGSIRIEAGNANFTAAGNKILNNKIHDVSDSSSSLDGTGYGGNGIYLDNSTGLVDVENNLVYRVSDTAVYTPHGPAQEHEANIVNNNILAFARQAMIGVNTPYNDGETKPNKAFVVTNNLMLFDRNANSAGQSFYVQGQCTDIGNLASYKDFQKFAGNLYWRTDGAFASDQHAFFQQTIDDNDPSINNPPCVSDPTLHANLNLWTFYSFAQWQALGEDKDSVVQDPHFLFPFFPIDNFWMPFGSPVSGFVPFNPNEAGRVFDPGEAERGFPGFEAPPVAPTFVTAPFNPGTDF